jgi:hypothetical protein
MGKPYGATHRHKFNAKKTDVDGITFASKKEAMYYKDLKLRQAVGDIVFFLRQVPFHLPGGVVYRCDFQVFEKDGSVRFIDVKGFRTKEFLMKKRQVEAIFPVEIEEV